MKKSLYLCAACVLLCLAQQLAAENEAPDECLLTSLQGGLAPDVTGFSTEDREWWTRQINAIKESRQHYINTRTADLLLIDLGHEETIESFICQVSGPPDPFRKRATHMLESSRQPQLILKVSDLLSLDEPLDSVLFDGCIVVSARPVYASMIIRGVIQNFEGFSYELKQWVKNSPNTREAEIELFRKWLHSNEKALREERWKEVRPI